MTPANAVETPAAVFPETTACTANATHDEIGVVMRDLGYERAALDAILALMCDSEYAETDPALGSAAMLMRSTIERINVVQENLDRVSINEYHRALKKEPVSAVDKKLNVVPKERLIGCRMNAATKDVFAALGHEMTMTRAMLDGARALIESSEHTVGDDSLLRAETLACGCLDRLETSWTTIDAATYEKGVDVNTVCFILMSELTLTRAMLDGAYKLINTSEHTDTDVALAHAQTLSHTCLARLEAVFNRIDRASVDASAQGAE